MKWIAQIAGYKGTEKRGFKYLRLVATKSAFASVNARSILVVLSLREKMYDEALENGRKSTHEHGPVELAQRLFTAAIQDPTTAERERALSYLGLAEVLDLRGNRQQAIANYQQVLSVANFEDSHSTAHGFLKKPYRRARCLEVAPKPFLFTVPPK